MATPAEVEIAIGSLSPQKLELFRLKLEHGQEGWAVPQYVELFKERRDLRSRMCDLLDLRTEEQKGILATLKSTKIALWSLFISIIALAVAIIAILK